MGGSSTPAGQWRHTTSNKAEGNDQDIDRLTVSRKDIDMQTADMTGTLGFGTLIVVLIIALLLLWRFLRKPENRHPMKGERERNIHEIRDEADGP